MSENDPTLASFDGAQRYRDLVEHTHDLIQSVDAQGHLVFVNAAWQNAFGWSAEEAQGMPLWSLIHQESMLHCQEAFQELMTSRLPVDIDARFVNRDGGDVYVRGIAKVLERDDMVITHAFLRDITRERAEEAERKVLEAELAQAQKMEALGRLTGGVAHDFNNLLTVIYANLDVMGETLDPSAKPYFDEVFNATESASALIQRLLSFFRKGSSEPLPTDVSTCVQNVERLLHNTAPPSVHLTCEAPEPGLIAVLDPNDLEHALINLVVNAIDATDPGGEIRLRAWGEQDPDHPNQGAVIVEVKDTGSGMPPEVAARIYEPFFTTKDADKGSGLGLAQVYGFVTRAGGTIQLATELGVGTSFRLRLPRSFDECV